VHAVTEQWTACNIKKEDNIKTINLLTY